MRNENRISVTFDVVPANKKAQVDRKVKLPKSLLVPLHVHVFSVAQLVRPDPGGQVLFSPLITAFLAFLPTKIAFFLPAYCLAYKSLLSNVLFSIGTWELFDIFIHSYRITILAWIGQFCGLKILNFIFCVCISPFFFFGGGGGGVLHFCGSCFVVITKRNYFGGHLKHFMAISLGQGTEWDIYYFIFFWGGGGGGRGAKFQIF